MSEKDIFEGMEGLSGFETDKEGIEKDLFGGTTAKEMIGNSADDPLTNKQLRMIFALGKEMGYEKDEIKGMYEVDSLSSLTIVEAIALIDQMQGHTEEKREKDLSAQTDIEKELEWTRTAGISRIDNSFAKCGHCVSFTGDNTLYQGKCSKNIIRGTYDGRKVIPMTEDCFEFKHGKLIRKTESEVVMPSNDYNPDED